MASLPAFALLPDRMPPLADSAMDDAQRAAAAELIAGPRKGVKGPFIPLMRSPELMARLQKVGEYLRFQSALAPRVSEFATLVVSRLWTQQFEWFVHVPLALKAGTSQATVDALREGRRPHDMSGEEALVHDFVVELLGTHGVSEASYLACRAALHAGHRRLDDRKLDADEVLQRRHGSSCCGQAYIDSAGISAAGPASPRCPAPLPAACGLR